MLKQKGSSELKEKETGATTHVKIENPEKGYTNVAKITVAGEAKPHWKKFGDGRFCLEVTAHKEAGWLSVNGTESSNDGEAGGNHPKEAELMPAQFTDQQIRNWRAYERVRAGGKYNMLDARARIAAGLDGAEYSFTMKNYSELKVAAKAQKPVRDYEPEQAWGSPAHFRKHRQFGGTREDY